MTYANNQEQFDNAYNSLCEYANTYPKLIEQINNNWMLNQEEWVDFHRDKIFHRETNTNNRLERYNRTLKSNCLTKSSDHLVEAIKQLVKHSTNLQREYIKRQTKQSMRYMKP